LKEHLAFLKSLYTFCTDRGYIIETGATVEEIKNTKTGEIKNVIKCTIRPIGESNGRD
jgi:hypothetical protein